LPYMPGGTSFMRNPPLPLSVCYPDGLPAGVEDIPEVNIDMTQVCDYLNRLYGSVTWNVFEGNAVETAWVQGQREKVSEGWIKAKVLLRLLKEFLIPMYFRCGFYVSLNSTFILLYPYNLCVGSSRRKVIRRPRARGFGEQSYPVNRTCEGEERDRSVADYRM